MLDNVEFELPAGFGGGREAALLTSVMETWAGKVFFDYALRAER